MNNGTVNNLLISLESLFVQSLGDQKIYLVKQLFDLNRILYNRNYQYTYLSKYIDNYLVNQLLILSFISREVAKKETSSKMAIILCDYSNTNSYSNMKLITQKYLSRFLYKYKQCNKYNRYTHDQTGIYYLAILNLYYLYVLLWDKDVHLLYWYLISN